MKILGMGVPELLIILVVILLIFGPKNLPKLGASLGKTVKNIRKGMGDEDDKKIDEVEVVDTEDSDVVEDVFDDDDDDMPATKKTTAKKRTTTTRRTTTKKTTEDEEAE